MTDRFGKSGLSSGTSWSLFAENTAFEEQDIANNKLEPSGETARLRIEDSKKFGFCPSQCSLALCVCKQCGKLILISTLQQHYDLKHQKALSAIKQSPLKRCIPRKLATPTTTTPSTPTTVTSKMMKSSTSATLNNKQIRIESEVDLNDKDVKIEEVPLTIPHFNNSVGAVPKLRMPTKLSMKKQCETKTKLISPISPQPARPVKPVKPAFLKEYDSDKHCGVWIPEHDKNCTRSLTCKTHTLSLRRQVPGRSKTFDNLLAEHRTRVKQHNDTTQTTTATHTVPSSRQTTPAHSPAYNLDKVVFPNVPSCPSSTDLAGTNLKSPQSFQNSPVGDSSRQENVDFISDDMILSSNLPTLSYHPRPIKTQTFGARQTNCRCRVFTRRGDHFRYTVSSLANKLTASIMNSKLNIKESVKLEHEGISIATQDPLQNGILHKQKKASSRQQNTMKRQLSQNDVQTGIIADSLSYTASAKQCRNSSDMPTLDNFMIDHLNDSLGSVAEETAAMQYLNQPPASVKYHKPPAEINRRSKSANAMVGNSFVVNNNNTAALTTKNKSKKNNATLEHMFSRTKVSAAPNITITQGMLLPNAVLQAAANTSTINNTLHQHQQINSIKQALGDVSLSVIQNGITTTGGGATKKYYVNNDHQPAPNITLQPGVNLTGTGGENNLTWSIKARAKQQQSDNERLLHQFLVQQQTENNKADASTVSLVSQTMTSSNPTLLTEQTRHPPNFLNAISSNNPALLKQLQKQQQQQQQQQQYAVIHQNYQQQILPKLTTLQQAQQQFATNVVPTNNTNSFPQQHGGALS